jgi:hypothetical protein
MAAYLFRQARLSLYHTICVKAVDGHRDLPLTRKDWYESRISEARVRQEAA